MKLEEKLVNQMRRLSLNGQKLAKVSRVSDSEISRILAGKSRPGLENAFRLARALGVSLDYLADDTLESDPLQNADPLTADEREVLALAHGIGTNRAARVLDIVRIVGYDGAMRRLLDARPIVEADPEARPGPVPAPAPPPGRAGSA
jgi:transcriptional regulator with XRE-family HTH domain